MGKALPGLVKHLKKESMDRVDGVSVPRNLGGPIHVRKRCLRKDIDLRSRRTTRDCTGGRMGSRGRHHWMSNHHGVEASTGRESDTARVVVKGVKALELP